MKHTHTVACFFLKSAWQARSLRYALAALLLAPLVALHAAASFTAVEPGTTLMQRIMKAADKNSDGFIDATKLAGALNKQTWFAILSESVESSFTRIDTNKDRKLDAPEYRRISKMGSHSEQHFKSADANKDGFLDFHEFTTHAEHRLAALESARHEKNRSIK